MSDYLLLPENAELFRLVAAYDYYLDTLRELEAKLVEVNRKNHAENGTHYFPIGQLVPRFDKISPFTDGELLAFSPAPKGTLINELDAVHSSAVKELMKKERELWEQPNLPTKK